MARNIEWLASMRDALSPAIRTAQANIERFAGATDRTERRFNNAFDNMSRHTHQLAVAQPQAFQAAEQLIPGMSSGMDMLSNKYLMVGTAATAIGAAAFGAYQRSNEFNKGMSEFNGTAHLTRERLAAVREQMLDVAGDSYVENINEVPLALTRIVSAGVPVKQAIADMGLHLKGAKAGFVDAETAAKAATTVMNAGGIKTTRQAYDMLFATMRDGAAEFKDIAQYAPKLLPSAKAIGISNEQTLGAFSFFTKVGSSASDATVLTQNLTKALGNKDRLAAFEKLGVSIFDKNRKFRDFGNIAADLAKKLDGVSDPKRIKMLQSLGLDMEAQNAVSTMTQNVDKLKESLQAVGDNKGSLNQVFDDTLSDADKWQQAMNKMTNAAVKFGGVVAPIFNGVAEKMMEVLNYLDNSKVGRDNKKNEYLRMQEEGYVPINFFSYALSPGKNTKLDNAGIPYAKDSRMTELRKATNAELRAEELARQGKFDAAREVIANSKAFKDAGLKANFSPFKIPALEVPQEDTRTKVMAGLESYIKHLGGDAASSADKSINTKDSTSNQFSEEAKKKNKAEDGLIIGGGRKSTNIYINIGKQNDGGIHIHAANLDEGAAQVESRMGEMLSRMVNNAVNLQQ